MRVLILNADYPGFLVEHYFCHPGLARSSYAEQMAARNDSLFGVADFYSRNFQAHGHEAMEVHINNPWLQYAWARENGVSVIQPRSPNVFAARHLARIPSPPPSPPGDAPPQGEAQHDPAEDEAALLDRLRDLARPVLKPVFRPFSRPIQVLRRRLKKQWELKILRAQIAAFRPDVILNHDLAYLRSPVFDRLKPAGSLLIGQIASSLPEQDTFRNYDLVISSLPNQVEWFRGRGVRSELNRLAFEPSVLEKLGPQPERDIPLSFVGSLSPDHVSRIAFLEHVATRTPLKVWGNGIERLPRSSPLHACYQGEAWGRDMYEVIRCSKITLNFHIDLAEGWANNMRLYEASGMGALLLTDWKKNLHEMFVPGEHVAAYRDAEDCVAQVHALLADDATRQRIAAAGQQQAIHHQNYYRRVGEIAALAEKLRSEA